MGFALIWSEGLAVALVAVALATAWTARGSRARVVGLAFIFLLFFSAAVALVVATGAAYTEYGEIVRTTWFFYSLTWLVAFTAGGLLLIRQGLRHVDAKPARSAAWPLGKLSLGFAGMVLAFGFTFWNMDLAARADAAVARQEAGAVLLEMTPPPVPASHNAARVYREAVQDLNESIRQPWEDALFRGQDARRAVDWNDPYVVELVKRHEGDLALLRKAAAMPGCDFERPLTLLAVTTSEPIPQARQLREGEKLLALDARVQALRGNLPGAFEDISALLGMVRHISGQLHPSWGMEAMAWRALEDVLRLAPAAKGPLPALSIPELRPMVRQVREEQALLSMLFPALASQPAPILKDFRRHGGPWAVFIMEAAVIPASRVFLLPTDLTAMHRIFAAYEKSPRSLRDETPRDWAELRQSVPTEPASLYGQIYIRPKFEKLLMEGSALAVLRQTAQTGLAVAKYHRQHGRYPDRLEQLVPAFLPTMPVDPRDGQPLRLRRFAEGVMVYAVQDSAAMENGKTPPVFRLYTPKPEEKTK
jgi:hypothetical protein